MTEGVKRNRPKYAELYREELARNAWLEEKLQESERAVTYYKQHWLEKCAELGAETAEKKKLESVIADVVDMYSKPWYTSIVLREFWVDVWNWLTLKRKDKHDAGNQQVDRQSSGQTQ